MCYYGNDTNTQKCQSSPPTRFSPFCQRCRWPACHPCSMPLISHCNCEKSAHKSTETVRKSTRINGGTEGKHWKKTYSHECLITLTSASRVHEPDLHRLVIAAAGQLAILALCHRYYTLIMRSQHTNQSKKKDQKLVNKLTSSSARSQALTNVHLEIFYICIIFEHVLINKK